MRLRPLLFVTARALAAGACIALALPPAGWWPLAFIGLYLWDRSLAGASWKRRLRRTWLVGIAWMGPTMLWMYDLTPPGYALAVITYSLYFGIAAALTPPGRARWMALPGAIVIATYVMWIYPFGGVPLANIALTQSSSCAPPCRQIDSPLPQAARLLGPLLVIALVVVVGIALSALWERRRRVAGIALAIVVAITALGFIAPRGYEVGELRIAIVQGGGPQHTPVGNEDAVEVFERHVKATRELVKAPVDIVLWPENIVSTDGPLEKSPGYLKPLQQLARDLNTTLIVGVTEDSLTDATFLNASVIVNPDGTLGERFDKVQRVPFGEYVPFRDLIKKLAGDQYLPPRDAVPGTDHGVLHTDTGDLGVVISWEDFFSERARDAIGNGGQILVNPTNGSSYWLTQVQTQQVASSRLRAIETGRFTVQSSPTGFSAVVAPNGALLERTDLEEARVIQTTLPLRDGTTLATLVGPWPMLALSIAAIVVAWILQRRGWGADATSAPSPDAADPNAASSSAASPADTGDTGDGDASREPAGVISPASA